MIARLYEALLDRSILLWDNLRRLLWVATVSADLVMASQNCASLDDIWDVILVLVLHVVIQVLLQLMKRPSALVGPFSERLRQTSILSLLLNHLKKVRDHLVLVSQFRRQVVVSHRLQIRDLMARVIECKILVDPHFDFIVSSHSDQLTVYVKGPEFLVDLLKGVCRFPEDVKAFGESELGQVAETMLDALGVYVEGSGLCTFANVGLLLRFGVLDAIDLVDSYKPQVVVFS